MRFKEFLIEKQSEFERLKKNKKPLSDDERKECFKRKATWNMSNKDNPIPAVWKSIDNKGNTTFVTNTHRAYNTAKTLKSAINKFHSFIKGTA